MTTIARLTALALASAALLTPGVAMTQEIGIYMLGEALTDDCRIYLSARRNAGQVRTTAEGYSAGLCYGFVIGVMDLNSGLHGWTAISKDDPQPAFCTSGVNAHTATEAVALYLDQHPEDRDKTGFFLVRKILAEKFPCLTGVPNGVA